MGRNLLRIFLLVVLLKLAYFGFYKICCLNSNTIGSGWNRDLVSLFGNYDTGWYEQIATKGYPEIDDPKDIGYHKGSEFKQSAWGFFPMYPLTVKALMLLTGSDFVHAAFGLSLLYTFLCFTGFFLLNTVVFKVTEKAAFYRTVLFSLLPFNYYFSVYLTEGLFFALVAFCFVSVKQERFWLLALLMIPLALIRVNGLILALPLFLFFAESKKDEGPFISRRNFKFVFYFIPALIAFGFFCLYCKAMTGVYFAFPIAQTGWYKKLTFPFLALFSSGEFAEQFNSIYALVYMLLIILFRKKFPLSLNVLLWMGVLVPLSSGSAMSLQRYLAAVFPYAVLLCLPLEKVRSKWLILPVLCVLHFATFYLWIASDDLGM